MGVFQQAAQRSCFVLVHVEEGTVLKFSTQILINLLHGIFLGLVIGITLAVVGNEILLPEGINFPFAYLIPTCAGFLGLLGLIKGYRNRSRLLFPLFSTPGTVTIPLLSLTISYSLVGFDRLLSLPPVLFKEGFHLSMMDTQLSTYILAIILSLTAVAAFVSSLTINKRKRWTW